LIEGINNKRISRASIIHAYSQPIPSDFHPGLQLAPTRVAYNQIVIPQHGDAIFFQSEAALTSIKPGDQIARQAERQGQGFAVGLSWPLLHGETLLEA
jgi:hypothetical protein